MNPSPSTKPQMSVAQLEELLNNPAFETQLEHYIKVTLEQQYGAALHDLNRLMQNPERTRDDIYELSGKLETSGTPTLKHLPALMALECTTREAGGRGYSRLEEIIFKQIYRVVARTNLSQHENEVQQLLTFLEGAFRYKRQYDSFATLRRHSSLNLAAAIAASTENPQALALLHEALAHPVAKVRRAAIVIIYKRYRDWGTDIPADIRARFEQMANTDRAKNVRQTALAVVKHRYL